MHHKESAKFKPLLPVRNDGGYPTLPCDTVLKEKHMAQEIRETGDLIGSDKVEGTAVYGADAQKIGSIDRVMINKISGKVAYAVLSFGGFLGIGDDHYPLPWPSLKYNPELGGYQTGVPVERLKDAPHYAESGDWNWADTARARTVNDYYGVPMV